LSGELITDCVCSYDLRVRDRDRTCHFHHLSREGSHTEFVTLSAWARGDVHCTSFRVIFTRNRKIRTVNPAAGDDLLQAMHSVRQMDRGNLKDDVIVPRSRHSPGEVLHMAPQAVTDRCWPRDWRERSWKHNPSVKQVP